MPDELHGWNQPGDGLTDHNMVAFQIAQSLRAVNTATICKVVKCTKTSEVSAVGQVDILPLVDMIDGKGQTSHHQNVLSMPYLRMHAGSRGIIMDPKVGDIGLVVFADRDIQAVKKAKKQSPPGSRRHHNMADGMYVGTVIADAPTSYVRFGDDGTIYVTPDNGESIVTVKGNDITVKIGDTLFEVKPNEIHAKAGLEVWIRPLRIDLGMKDAPHAVVTVDGPSEKVFAVIGESP